MWPAVTVAKMAVSSRNTGTNTRLPTLEIIGGDTMKIKCPYCGSTEYETFDTTGGNGQAISELCVCFECDNTFRVIYAPDCIEKES